MTLGFTDGDGNVGLTQADTLPPFCSTCEHHFNLVAEYQEWNGEAWDTPDLLIPYAYRVPVATPTGSSPALDGTLGIGHAVVAPLGHPSRFGEVLVDLVGPGLEPLQRGVDTRIAGSLTQAPSSEAKCVATEATRSPHFSRSLTRSL